MENRHTYVLGQSGSGKSTFIANDFFRELETDRALFFIDPHGENFYALADALPRRLIKRTVLIDCADYHYAVGFDPITNPLHTLSGLKSIWIDSWGPRMEWLLLNALHVIHQNGKTFRELPLLFVDSAFRARMLERIDDPQLRAFWRTEFPAKYEHSRDNPDSPILNKIGQLNLSRISRVLCQRSPKMDFRDVLDRRGIVLLNLSKPTLGDEAAAILGALFTSSLRGALLEHPTPTTLYADEFQTYGTGMYAAMLSEMRKFGLRMVLANQFLTQIDIGLRHAILANAASKIIFRVQHEDAMLLAPMLSDRPHQPLDPNALTRLPPYTAYVDGVHTPLPQFKPPFGTGKLDAVQHHSRLHFARRF
jgi:hypothetical protein